MVRQSIKKGKRQAINKILPSIFQMWDIDEKANLDNGYLTMFSRQIQVPYLLRKFTKFTQLAILKKKHC